MTCTKFKEICRANWRNGREFDFSGRDAQTPARQHGRSCHTCREWYLHNIQAIIDFVEEDIPRVDL